MVDNASTDSTSDVVAQRFPQVGLISLERNIGAAARNFSVQQVQMPCVAFSDDDSWWACGSLNMAVGLLDAYPRTAALCGRILLGPGQREDSVCKAMASSPLPSTSLKGALLNALSERPWICRERKVFPSNVEALYRKLRV